MSKELLDQPVSGPMTPEFITKVRDAVLWEVTVWQSRPPESEPLHFRRQGQFDCSGKSCDHSSASRPPPARCRPGNDKTRASRRYPPLRRIVEGGILVSAVAHRCSLPWNASVSQVSLLAGAVKPRIPSPHSWSDRQEAGQWRGNAIEGERLTLAMTNRVLALNTPLHTSRHTTFLTR